MEYNFVKNNVVKLISGASTTRMATTLYLLKSNCSFITLPSALGNHHSTFGLDEFNNFKYVI